MAKQSVFLEQLMSELRRMPISALPAVVAAIRSAPSKAGGGSPRSLDQIAEAVLALPDISGSKLDNVERAIVLHAVDACHGNISAAARLLGVDRKMMERRVARARRSRR